jgi:hypothetical protein
MLIAFHFPSLNEQCLYIAIFIIVMSRVLKWGMSHPKAANTFLRVVSALIIKRLR